MTGRANQHINQGAENQSNKVDPKITAVAAGLK